MYELHVAAGVKTVVSGARTVRDAVGDGNERVVMMLLMLEMQRSDLGGERKEKRGYITEAHPVEDDGNGLWQG